jgi:hypothetical protein
VSFGLGNPNFMEWRANITSRGRALLMLFLFSDVGEMDALTRIRVGSHIDIARILAPEAFVLDVAPHDDWSSAFDWLPTISPRCSMLFSASEP